jgi:hypothetical protein
MVALLRLIAAHVEVFQKVTGDAKKVTVCITTDRCDPIDVTGTLLKDEVSGEWFWPTVTQDGGFGHHAEEILVHYGK